MFRPVKCLNEIGGSTSDISEDVVLSTKGDGATEIILDYGRAEGGIPTFETRHVTSNESSVSIQVIYSETSQGLHSAAGDGPFFLFSNAMDTYRVNTHTFATSDNQQLVESRFAQKSQRYQKIVLTSPNSTICFSSIGFREDRVQLPIRSSFRCSNKKLEKIWNAGVRTLEMCTVQAGETRDAWEVTDEGTRVLGQHWAPCRHGTRWGDYCAKFQVKIETSGASWGVHMVANGLIFCIDTNKKSIAAFEGLSDSGGVFPTIPRGSWSIPASVDLSDWLDVSTTTSGASANVEINGQSVAQLDDLNIHPILGGSGNNTGSIAFGGPSHYSALYRSLIIQTATGETLYENDLLSKSKARTMFDFAVGTNDLACTIDGAKRDRVSFAGDLLVMGRSICYSTGFVEAVIGTITLLASHQTSAGYLGNICPIQAPVHSGQEEPPTYAFYSLSYALALIVATKNYVMHTGDVATVKKLYASFEKLLTFSTRFKDERGIVVAPPPLSMDWFPMGGPIFGASGKINLTVYDALNSMHQMAALIGAKDNHQAQAQQLKADIRSHLWNADTSILRMSDLTSPTGVCQDIHAYALALGIADPNKEALDVLEAPSSGQLPPAFHGLDSWDSKKVVSPYASGFAAEALFKHDRGQSAVELIERVWGVMVDESHPDYSGGCWEAMNLDGGPITDDTSLMHGWSTSPVFLLPQYLTGLSALEPGWTRFQIQPIFTDIEVVEAELEVPAGKIFVSVVHHASTSDALIEAMVPVGSIAELLLPKGWVHTSNGESDIKLEGREEVFKLEISFSETS